ncbi:MAG: hypothetical protein ACK4EX_05475 [Thermaurantimonas sp.]|uniref:hypothetical protein n=1 Tax=Thermaurantimonas sp. TaxID=2681568 RepID=UPI00391CBD6E
MKSLKTVLLPALVLVVLNVLYFAPAIGGKLIPQDDILHGLGISKEIRDWREKTGEEALWTNALFSGMPGFQCGVIYWNNVYHYLQQLLARIFVINAEIYTIAWLMVGMYFLLVVLGVEYRLAAVGGLAFGFSAFFIISFGAGHVAKVRTAALIAPTLASILLAYQGRKWLGWALTAFFIGMAINSNHIQITYYQSFMILVVVVLYAVLMVRAGKLKEWFIASAGLLLAAVIGILPNVSHLWTNYVYQKETMRGGISELSKNQEFKGGLDFDYAMMWSYSPVETFNLVIPNATGGGIAQNYEGTRTHDAYFLRFRQMYMDQGMNKKMAEEQANRTIASFFYWGEQSLVNGGYYIGAVVFFLFVLAFFVVERHWLITLGVLIVLSIAMAWGKHLEGFNRMLFDYLPLFKKFRVPSMAFTILFVAVPMLGFMALQRFLNLQNKKEAEKKLLKAVYIAGGFCLFFIVLGGALFDFTGNNDEMLRQNGLNLDQLVEDRIGLLRSSAGKTLLFVLLAAGALWAHLKGFVKAQVLPLILGALVLFDQWSFTLQHLSWKDFVSQQEFEKPLRPTQANIQISQDPDPHFRVFNAQRGLTSDAFTSYHHHSIAGYHGAKLGRYQDLIDAHLSKGNEAVFNMLNTKYIISNDQPQFNPNACGNAWFVREIRWAKNADEEIGALNAPFDPKTTVVIDERYKGRVTKNDYSPDGAEIKLTSYTPNVLRYSVSNPSGSQFAVFSEIYYEGSGSDWKAYIDGKEARHIRVNYALRGMELPAGQYEVEFRFEPESYLKGEQYARFASIGFLILFGAGLFLSYKNGEIGSKDEQ